MAWGAASLSSLQSSMKCAMICTSHGKKSSATFLPYSRSTPKKKRSPCAPIQSLRIGDRHLDHQWFKHLLSVRKQTFCLSGSTSQKGRSQPVDHHNNSNRPSSPAASTDLPPRPRVPTTQREIANRLIAIPTEKAKTTAITETTVIGRHNPFIINGWSLRRPSPHARARRSTMAGRAGQPKGWPGFVDEPVCDPRCQARHPLSLASGGSPNLL